MIVDRFDSFLRKFPQQGRQFCIVVPASIQMRADYGDVWHYSVKVQPRLSSRWQIKERFFNKQNPVLAGESRQELLRALPDKSPAQMAEHHDAVAIGALHFDQAVIAS